MLAFLAQHPIDEEQLLATLKTPALSPDRLIANWHHQLACILLKKKLAQIFPPKIQANFINF